MGALTQGFIGATTKIRCQLTRFSNRAKSLIYSDINSTHVCFSLNERKAATNGYIRRYNFVCTLRDLLRTRNFLQVLTISPRICRACRPTPCPHSACKRDALSVRLPKLGGAGGSLLILPRTAKSPTSALGRGGCAPRLWLRCSAGRTGSAGYAADRTPAGAGALRRWGAVVAVCRQMRGGEHRLRARPSRVGSLALPGTRRERVLTFVPRCPHRARARARVILILSSGCSLMIPGQPQVPRRHAPPRHARRVANSAISTTRDIRRTTIHEASARWCTEAR